MKSFQSPSELEAWLEKNGIDISQWGTGGKKSVANLWDELISGDIELRDCPPVRVVRVVQIVIRKGNRVLREVGQVFGDGERRVRNRLPSEKIKKGEEPRDAALRCLKEELDIDERYVASLKPAYEDLRKETDSPSYPGLSAHYTFLTLEAEVSGLPDEDFWRANVARGDPVVRQHWVWSTEPVGQETGLPLE